MNRIIDKQSTGWTSSVYYADTHVRCSLDKAWLYLLDYQSWNPDFIGAHVSRVRGERAVEGELVLIKEQVPDASGVSPPEFYAETVKVVPQHHIVWCVYPKTGEEFRNFIDLALMDTSAGLRFDVSYYEQNWLTGEALNKHRKETQAVYVRFVAAFKGYCEANA